MIKALFNWKIRIDRKYQGFFLVFFNLLLLAINTYQMYHTKVSIAMFKHERISCENPIKELLFNSGHDMFPKVISMLHESQWLEPNQSTNANCQSAKERLW